MSTGLNCACANNQKIKITMKKKIPEDFELIIKKQELTVDGHSSAKHDLLSIKDQTSFLVA
jgi:hypothetical protein